MLEKSPSGGKGTGGATAIPVALPNAADGMPSSEVTVAGSGILLICAVAGVGFGGAPGITAVTSGGDIDRLGRVVSGPGLLLTAPLGAPDESGPDVPGRRLVGPDALEIDPLIAGFSQPDCLFCSPGNSVSTSCARRAATSFGDVRMNT